MKIAKMLICDLIVCMVLLLGCKNSSFTNPIESTSNADYDIGCSMPKLTNEYSQACNAYREFLLGQRNDEDGQPLFYEYKTRIVGNCESTLVANADFTLIDINGDGIPELHFRANHYCIYSYRDGQVFKAYACSQDARLLNNLAVYSDFWDRNHEEEATRSYVELGKDLQLCFSLNFDFGNDIYRIGYNQYSYNQNELKYLSKEEFEAITLPVLTYCTDSKNYDMIPWVDYGKWLFEHVDEYVPYE